MLIVEQKQFPKSQIKPVCANLSSFLDRFSCVTHVKIKCSSHFPGILCIAWSLVACTLWPTAS